jgi:hypothetical protein
METDHQPRKLGSLKKLAKARGRFSSGAFRRGIPSPTNFISVRLLTFIILSY